MGYFHHLLVLEDLGPLSLYLQGRMTSSTVQTLQLDHSRILSVLVLLLIPYLHWNSSQADFAAPMLQLSCGHIPNHRQLIGIQDDLPFG